MKLVNNIVLICLISFSYYYLFCAASDAIIVGKPISDGEHLISKGKKFVLGFFSPSKSSSRYVGIWYYNLSNQTVVWIANRDNPINDTSGVLSLITDGNLILHRNNSNFPIWSTNVSVTVSSTTVMAQLSDVGNLVLIQNNSKAMFWQSFDHPTDTFLPYAKLGFNKRTGQNWFFQSWRTEDDPATGSLSIRFNSSGKAQLFLYKQNVPVWRVGSFNGEILVGLPAWTLTMLKTFLINLSFTEDDNEIVTIPSGYILIHKWDDNNKYWKQYGSSPEVACDLYGSCGPNSNCDSYNYGYKKCSCLPGFEPRNPNDWYEKDDQSAGCVRKKGPPLCRNGEGFIKVESVKIPDTSIANVRKGLSMEKCEQECLRNCSCTAYAAADVTNGGSGCLAWHGTLMDTIVLKDEGHDFYVRVDAIELENYNRKSKGTHSMSGMMGILIAVFVITLLIVIHVYCFWMKKKKDKMAEQQINVESPSEEELGVNRTQVRLPFFNIKTIQVATNSFSSENELGHGGFGSVYKGLLVNGQEIAVKRLSKGSGQGIEEFKNEIKLIAKLQHRNLVRLLGYCIHKEERMLIYEYLPNKSLDFYLFDMNQRSSLDWDKRVHIIFGIAQGLLYLHRDSRLKIIHRDLKASNVLLDATMNPKISDFGMARIFGEDQIQARTRRIVGTYGYMSPEYAMEGQYSTKSDVFSFGILLLEIVSARRNTDREKEGSHLNLIGQVWDLWREGKVLEVVDSTLGESYPVDVILRYIKIGLLCVQEIVVQRPSISEVIFMLSNEVSLPSPQKPAFLFNSNDSETAISREASANVLTHSTMSGR
ncbi:hypothetical protein K1719_005048 [Acacia pycnantha]|nr:hypothetical protein K1719_005048 [Acacia pycnantha]